MFEWYTPSTAAALALVFLVVCWFRQNHTLDAIPTVGHSAPFLSYITAFRFITHAHLWIEEGYRKLVEDVVKAPDHILSAHGASRHTDHTFGPGVMEDPNHVAVIQMQLTRALATVFGDMYDELSATFDEAIPAKADGWMQVPVGEVLRDVICRVSNRVFVGAPLCRDKEYQQLNIAFSQSVFGRAWAINQFPRILRPIAGRFLSQLPALTRLQEKHLRPLIDDRRRKLEEHGGHWEGKPNDMLMWLMEAAKDDDASVVDISRRMLVVNFAAIHTTSMTLTHALYHLAESPEYVQPLRDEVEAVVASEGWSKSALGKMRKVDSFLRESQRLHGINTVAVKRLSLQPFTFSNGVTIPAGVFLSCPSRATHADDAHYPRADVFDGFRFAKLRESEGTKHQLASTTPEYLAFAHGRHACPGRFFAANELKAMLAHIVLTYDVKFPEGCDFPPDRFVGTVSSPGQADLLFRKRQV
ncbi:cytochrome P450 [Artomyces pyxidatus]|uniref:Cytochrome P450 n=1 Tax=Artomyces pyxidatus TaxID=48021 RepID=A0ACB8SWT5_9AGAM|nr:cytochrome P450 [Artomyces pyxidatus]